MKLTPEEMYRGYCGACHDLKMVENQHLDRGTWEWVMEDVVTKYGGTWITPPEQKVLVDYLVEHFGPKK